MGVKSWALASVAALTLTGAALAQAPYAPSAAPMPPAINAPRDVAYPGTLTLEVDASDVQRGVFRVHETISVADAGPLTLLYPQWLPGNHAPRGPIEKLANLVITANGQPVAWMRDPVNVYAFHVNPPAGVLDVRFEYLTPTGADQGRVVSTPNMLNLQWNAVTLYPAGYYARRINVAPSVTLPEGWQFGTALDVEATTGATTRFQDIDFENLVDSPMFAGRYFRRIDLNPGGGVPVHMDMIADRADLLAATEAQIAPHRNLIQQEFRLFGSHHYNHYDVLLTLSETMGGIGLEHHRSSENGTGHEYFTDWANYLQDRDLLAHETTHSWNGKFRRPADLWTPNFDVPMRNSLLWVYEGQTQYWGHVLAARSGLWTREQGLMALARTAATYDQRVGRQWRSVEDTTNDPIIARRQPQAWRSWQRSEDYYSEGQLIWLDADTLIRERTHNRRSLDTFAHDFFGVDDGSWVPHTYTFEDVVAALNRVMPYDWASFLNQRINQPTQHAPLDGVTRGGYRLVYIDVRDEMQKSAEKRRDYADFIYSLGINVAAMGRISEVVWDGPAFNQGVTVGTTLVAVDGAAYSGDVLRRAVTAAKTDTNPIELLVRNGDRFRSVQLDYHDGLRYPHLERIPGAPDLLSAIYTPRR